MKGYKVDMRGYEVEGIPVDPVEMFSNVMLGQQLQLTGGQFYARSKKVDRLLGSIEKGYMVMGEEDYSLVKDTFEKTKGFGPLHREVVRRIFEAEEVELGETGGKKKKQGA